MNLLRVFYLKRATHLQSTFKPIGSNSLCKWFMQMICANSFHKLSRLPHTLHNEVINCNRSPTRKFARRGWVLCVQDLRHITVSDQSCIFLCQANYHYWQCWKLVLVCFWPNYWFIKYLYIQTANKISSSKIRPVIKSCKVTIWW